MALESKFCGFDEVRFDLSKGGFFCSCCGKRMHEDFRAVVEASLPKEFVERLDELCTLPS